jgi:hypothetical protein
VKNEVRNLNVLTFQPFRFWFVESCIAVLLARRISAEIKKYKLAMRNPCLYMIRKKLQSVLRLQLLFKMSNASILLLMVYDSSTLIYRNCQCKKLHAINMHFINTSFVTSGELPLS